MAFLLPKSDDAARGTVFGLDRGGDNKALRSRSTITLRSLCLAPRSLLTQCRVQLEQVVTGFMALY